MDSETTLQIPDYTTGFDVAEVTAWADEQDELHAQRRLEQIERETALATEIAAPMREAMRGAAGEPPRIDDSRLVELSTKQHEADIAAWDAAAPPPDPDATVLTLPPPQVASCASRRPAYDEGVSGGSGTATANAATGRLTTRSELVYDNRLQQAWARVGAVVIVRRDRPQATARATVWPVADVLAGHAFFGVHRAITDLQISVINFNQRTEVRRMVTVENLSWWFGVVVGGTVPFVPLSVPVSANAGDWLLVRVRQDTFVTAPTGHTLRGVVSDVLGIDVCGG